MRVKGAATAFGRQRGFQKPLTSVQQLRFERSAQCQPVKESSWR